MALRRRKKDRELVVTKALLLGYTFKRIAGGYYAYLPNGAPLTEFQHSSSGKSYGPYVVHFPELHLAASAALIHAGVLHAPKPRGDYRISPS